MRRQVTSYCQNYRLQLIELRVKGSSDVGLVPDHITNAAAAPLVNNSILYYSAKWRPLNKDSLYY